MAETFSALLSALIPLNTLKPGPFTLDLFMVGLSAPCLLYVSIGFILGLFVPPGGRPALLHEKSFAAAGGAVLFFCLGVCVSLLPPYAPALSLAAYLIQSLGLGAYGVFLCAALYGASHNEHINPFIFAPLAAVAILAVILPFALGLPVSFFLGPFYLILFVLFLPLAFSQKGSGAIAAVLGFLPFGAAFFIPLLGLRLLLWTIAILLFLGAAKKHFFFFPQSAALSPPELIRFALAANAEPAAEPARPPGSGLLSAAEKIAAGPAGKDGAVSGEKTGETLLSRHFIRELESNDGMILPVKGDKPGVQTGKAESPINPFIPKEFLKILHRNTVMDLQLGDHTQQEMTVFFSDIRQFTSLTERLTPEESFKFINSYLSRIVPVITEHGGFVDKFIGDAVMALYPQKDGADRAVRSAIEIQRTLQTYNEQRAKHNYSHLSIGVGIHMGSLMIGVVGVKDRMQNTVISDAVNQASRLEGMCKAYNVSLVISEEIFKGLEDPGSYMYRFLGKVRVKGKSEPVSVFEIYDGIDPDTLERKRQANRFWEEGMLSFSKQDYSGALFKFQKVREILPEDGAAIHYTDHCMKKLGI
ncbi:hypothetical protein AGMMS50268_23100 [Spirochaetia bacterium]|nr:hypothetical protein AGMMS50268_23100 [Spirochaetia bacterium]